LKQDEKAELLLPDSQGIDQSLDLIDKLFDKGFFQL